MASTVTYKYIKQNPDIMEYIRRADKALEAQGYTEHSFAHVEKVAHNAAMILTTLGYGKISYAKDVDIQTEDGSIRHYDGYRLTHRGAKGVTTLNMTAKNGALIAVRAVNGDEDLLVITSTGVVIRTPLQEVKIAGRNTQGVKIINLDEKAKVASITIMPHSDAAEDDGLPEGEGPAEQVDDSDVIEGTEAEEVVTPDEVDE